MVESPILLITFNRPDTTQMVFDAIKRARPAKLYIFNDGPRLGNERDLKAREKIRSILVQVDWECILLTKFSEKNLGCGIGVSRAISWAFENEDRLIIMEDDCKPANPFFQYCDILLEKYKVDNRICMISGNNYSEDKNGTYDSYFFSKYGHIWGWATWKRVWDKYDYEMKDWPAFRETNQLSNVFTTRREQEFFLKYFNDIYKKDEKGTWDFQWGYCRIKEYGLSIVPSRNLVTNIGIHGIHTDSKSKAHFIPVDEEFAIVNEPRFVLCNAYYDRHHFKEVIHKRRTLLSLVLNFPIRVLKKALRIMHQINNDSAKK